MASLFEGGNEAPGSLGTVIMMDVIKMESEVNSVAVGIGDDMETEEKLLPEVDNMLDHDTDERKVELVDPCCGLTSSLCFEEMPVPITFPVVKIEPEEHSWDMDEKNLDVATDDNAILPDKFTGPCDASTGNVLDNESLIEGMSQSDDLGLQQLTASQRNHNLLDSEDKPFKCEFCSLGYKLKSSLKSHLRLHTGDNPLRCEICGKYFSFSQGFRHHMRSAHKPSFKCDICFKKLPTPDSLKIHLEWHSTREGFQCSICGKGLANANSLYQHLKRHTGVKPYKCNLCPRAFTTKDSLDYHIRSHTGERPFRCEECGRSFKNKRCLRVHKCKRPQFTCDISLENLPTQGSLTVHRIFKCSICGKGLANGKTLKRHLNTHTGVKPHKCNVCHREFSRKSSLDYHIRSHTGERPFRCEDCGCQFKGKKLLKQHKCKQQPQTA
ncbi:zinc finger protein 69-like isoform X5 [Periplaneta americana]|uniref:zinc finger protein 69-like isoform X5 n=1 Tax=Periplaneta americana TaxID=6978 RepID=UPI0037E7DFDC